jgi:hypothetical protein
MHKGYKTMIQTVAVLGMAGLVFGALRWQLGVGESRLAIRTNGVHFPTVSGFNLDRQELEFPRDFGGELNIVFVPFLQYQQQIVDTWVPFVQGVEFTYPTVMYYELPTIDERSRLSRTFINEGMRAGIPDQTSRERTVTLYIDIPEFQKAIGISGKDEVHILLVNRNGDILWRTTGRLDNEKEESLLAAIEANQ